MNQMSSKFPRLVQVWHGEQEEDVKFIFAWFVHRFISIIGDWRINLVYLMHTIPSYGYILGSPMISRGTIIARNAIRTGRQTCNPRYNQTVHLEQLVLIVLCLGATLDSFDPWRDISFTASTFSYTCLNHVLNSFHFFSLLTASDDEDAETTTLFFTLDRVWLRNVSGGIIAVSRCNRYRFLKSGISIILW
jgi:hypothetical protein